MKVFSHIFIIIGQESEFMQYLLLFSQNMNEDISKTSEKPPLCPSATLSASATMEENGFGSKKARSSFGKGFFKIRGGKKTSSAPNLGKCVLHDIAAYRILLVVVASSYCTNRNFNLRLLPRVCSWSIFYFPKPHP